MNYQQQNAAKAATVVQENNKINMEQLKVKALHDKVIIKRIDLQQVSKGGIILGQEVEKERDTEFGKVVAVGPGKQVDGTGIIPTTSKVGDIVSFMSKIPRRVMLKGQEFYILRESDVDFINEDEEIQEVRYEKSTSDYDNLSVAIN